jgi:hypothetical protein
LADPFTGRMKFHHPMSTSVCSTCCIAPNARVSPSLPGNRAGKHNAAANTKASMTAYSLPQKPVPSMPQNGPRFSLTPSLQCHGLFNGQDQPLCRRPVSRNRAYASQAQSPLRVKADSCRGKARPSTLPICKPRLAPPLVVRSRKKDGLNRVLPARIFATIPARDRRAENLSSSALTLFVQSCCPSAKRTRRQASRPSRSSAKGARQRACILLAGLPVGEVGIW